jgi:hypothetical protein
MAFSCITRILVRSAGVFVSRYVFLGATLVVSVLLCILDRDLVSIGCSIFVIELVELGVQRASDWIS